MSATSTDTQQLSPSKSLSASRSLLVPSTEAPTTLPAIAPLTRPPFTPIPIPHLAAQLNMTLFPGTEIAARQGDVRQVSLNVTNVGLDSWTHARVDFDTSFGFPSSPDPRCKISYQSTVRGFGFSVSCDTSSLVGRGDSYICSFLVVYLVDVPLPTASIPLSATVRITESLVTAGHAELGLPVQVASTATFHVSDFEPGLNEIDLGGCIVITGTGLSALPRRLLVGPFPADVMGNDTAASLCLPEPSVLPALPGCGAEPSSDDIAAAVVLATNDVFARAFLAATLRDADLRVLQETLRCINGTSQWHPADFAARQEVVPATNFSGLRFELLDAQQNKPIQYAEPGVLRLVAVSVPDLGPYQFANASELSAALAFRVEDHVDSTPLVAGTAVEGSRRQTLVDSSVVHRFSGKITPLPTQRGFVQGTLTVTNVDMLQRWRAVQDLELRLPFLHVARSANPAPEALLLELGLANGTLVLSPTVDIAFLESAVPATFGFSSDSSCDSSAGLTAACGYCVLDATRSSVTCRPPVQWINATTTLPLRVVAPSYFKGPINVSVTATGVNGAPFSTLFHVIISNDMRAPGGVATVTDAPGLGQLSPLGIFQLQPSGGLHFVITTLAVFVVLIISRATWYVFRRRHRPEISWPPEPQLFMRSLLAAHVWLGVIFPCHYRCAVVHLTLACCAVFGMYVCTALMYYYSGAHAMDEWSFHILVGFTAAFFQLATRPLLSAPFNLYRIYDPNEITDSSGASAEEKWFEAPYGDGGLPFVDSIVDDIDILPPVSYNAKQSGFADLQAEYDVTVDAQLVDALTTPSVLRPTQKKASDSKPGVATSILDAVKDEPDIEFLWDRAIDLEEDVIQLESESEGEEDIVLEEDDITLNFPTDPSSSNAASKPTSGLRLTNSEVLTPHASKSKLKRSGNSGAGLNVSFALPSAATAKTAASSTATPAAAAAPAASNVDEARTTSSIPTRNVEIALAGTLEGTLGTTQRSASSFGMPTTGTLQSSASSFDRSSGTGTMKRSSTLNRLAFEAEQLSHRPTDSKPKSKGPGSSSVPVGGRPVTSVAAVSHDALDDIDFRELFDDEVVLEEGTSASEPREKDPTVPEPSESATPTILDDELEIVVVTRHLDNYRSLGYGVAVLYIILCAAATYVSTAGWSKAQLHRFWTTMTCAFISDALVAEFVFVGLTVLYRWLVQQGSGPLEPEFHPYEGEKMLRDF